MDDLVVPAVVPVLGGEEPLGQDFVVVLPPGRDEGGEWLVLLVQWDAVVAVLGIKTAFP